MDLIKIGINPKHKYTYIYEYFVYFIHIPVELEISGDNFETIAWDRNGVNVLVVYFRI